MRAILLLIVVSGCTIRWGPSPEAVAAEKRRIAHERLEAKRAGFESACLSAVGIPEERVEWCRLQQAELIHAEDRQERAETREDTEDREDDRDRRERVARYQQLQEQRRPVNCESHELAGGVHTTCE